MCYLCLKEAFKMDTPKSKTDKTKERALEIKQMLIKAEGSQEVCFEIIEKLKEEQYLLSRNM